MEYCTVLAQKALKSEAQVEIIYTLASIESNTNSAEFG